MIDFAVKYITIVVLTFILAAPVSAKEGGNDSGGGGDDGGSEESAPEPKEFYISADMYPIIEVFGGWGSGFTYKDGPAVIAKRFAGFGATEGALGDVGETLEGGVNFRFCVNDYFDFGLGMFHQLTKKRTASYRFDYANVPVKSDTNPGGYFGPFYVTDTLSYTVNNLDLKLRFGFTPFPNWFIEPYIVGGIGVNYLMVRLTESIPGAKVPNLIFDNKLLGKYTFDAAGYGGLRFNLLDSTYLYMEGYYDAPFSNSYVYGEEGANGRIDTTGFGARIGVGFRMR
jgi:hypothetical protein